MVQPVNVLAAPIPRPLLWIGVPVAAVVLIALFVFLRFPYDGFAPVLEQQLGAATGSDVRIGDIEPRITIGGPGIAARNIRISTPDGRFVDIDPLRIRPAWSTSWLRGEPALQIGIGSLIGRSEGVLVLGDPTRWRGEVHELDLARLPIGGLQGLELTGTVVAAADLEIGAVGPTGPLSFDATAGSIAHPMMPIALEFERVVGDLNLGDDPLVTVRNLELEGPVVSANVEGAIRPGRGPGDEQLDLDVELVIEDPSMRAMLQQLGVRLDGRGRAQFELGGTLSAPRPR